jgi:hypothetical protein
MEQTARVNANKEFETFFRQYSGIGFKPLFCHGYSGGSKDYKKAKTPTIEGWTKTDYQAPTLRQCEDHIAKAGWIGWLIPEGVIVLDVEDTNSIGVLEAYLKAKNLHPPIHRSRNGKHYFFSGNGISGSSKEFTRLGISVTYRVGGKNYLILAPCDERSWEVPLD